MTQRSLFVLFGVTGALGVGVAIAVAHWARESFFLFAFSVFSFFGAVGMGGAGLVCHWLAKRFDLKALRWVKGATLWLSFLLIFPVLSFIYGDFLNNADVREAENFCEQHIFPFLEAHKERTGSYPEEVEDTIRNKNNLPQVMRRNLFYQTHQGGQTFVLGFSDPGGFIEPWVYHSSRKVWHYD